MSDQPLDPELSIVIPLYNEAENVEPLYAELSAALAETGRSYEVLIVDDGSRDDSFARLKAVHERDPRWRIIRFRRNFGQTAGFSAGFDAAAERSSSRAMRICRTTRAISRSCWRRWTKGSTL